MSRDRSTRDFAFELIAGICFAVIGTVAWAYWERHEAAIEARKAAAIRVQHLEFLRTHGRSDAQAQAKGEQEGRSRRTPADEGAPGTGQRR